VFASSMWWATSSCLAPPQAPVGDNTRASGEEVRSLWDGEHFFSGQLPSGWAACEPKVKCSASVDAHAALGRNGSAGLRFHAEGGEWAGVGWHWLGLLATAGTDVTLYDALSFWVRVVGTRPDLAPMPERVWVALAGASGLQSGHLAVEDCAPGFTDGRWHQVVIPVRVLFTNGNKGLDPKNVTGMTLFTAAPRARSFDLYLDEISVQRLGPESVAKLCQAGEDVTALGPIRVLWNGEEARSTRPGAGWASCKESGRCSTSMEPVAGVGRQGSTGLRFHAEGPGWIGAGWNWRGFLVPRGTDLTAHDALTFWIRVQSESPDLGPFPGRVWVSLTGRNERQSRTVLLEHCTAGFSDGCWHKVVIPLQSFHATGPQQFDPKDVLGERYFAGIQDVTMKMPPRRRTSALAGIPVIARSARRTRTAAGQTPIVGHCLHIDL
jgi:hypothetical protein